MFILYWMMGFAIFNAIEYKYLSTKKEVLHHAAISLVWPFVLIYWALKEIYNTWTELPDE